MMNTWNNIRTPRTQTKNTQKQTHKQADQQTNKQTSKQTTKQTRQETLANRWVLKQKLTHIAWLKTSDSHPKQKVDVCIQNQA